MQPRHASLVAVTWLNGGIMSAKHHKRMLEPTPMVALVLPELPVEPATPTEVHPVSRMTKRAHAMIFIKPLRDIGRHTVSKGG